VYLDQQFYLLFWPGMSLKELEGARTLINLAGISVNCRYHARNRKLILDSRPERAGL
jgi:hypothetical protein